MAGAEPRPHPEPPEEPAMPMPDPAAKYRAFPQVDLPDRSWPNRTITKAPMRVNGKNHSAIHRLHCASLISSMAARYLISEGMLIISVRV